MFFTLPFGFLALILTLVLACVLGAVAKAAAPFVFAGSATRRWLTIAVVGATLAGGYVATESGWLLHAIGDSQSALLQPDPIRTFADRLAQNHLIDAEAHARLLDDVRRGRVSSTFDLLRYCGRARGFELARYPSDPARFLPTIHADVAQILPELRFTDFQYAVEVDRSLERIGYVSHRLRVSMAVNGTRYVQTSFIDPDAPAKGHDFGRIDEQEFYEIFNKVLSDHGSAYRLHLVKFTTPFGLMRAADYSRFGVIALTSEQADALRPLQRVGRDWVQYLDVSYENFDRRPSPADVRAAIAVYRSAGILGDIPDDSLGRFSEQALASSYRTYKDIIAAFPNVTYVMWLKDDGEKPYAGVLRELAAISRGHFTPERIVDESKGIGVEQQARVSFALGDKDFSVVMTTNRTWIDLQIIEFVIRAQKETDPAGRFYTLKDDNDVTLIYLTASQYEMVREKGILEFSP